MNYSEAGKLGALALAKSIKKIVETRIIEYNKNPVLCKNCNAVIDYHKKRNKFCSHSCAAVYNAFGLDDNLIKRSSLNFICLSCSLSFTDKSHKHRKYCSIKCQQQYELEASIKTGTASSKTCKRYLLQKFSNKCFECGITEWNNKPIVMELEHLDGNSDNNSINNLSLLCPNCHSQTSTYKAKNIGKGRHYRRQRYKDGKSF